MAVTTSSGNGFALYNGVKLPDITPLADYDHSGNGVFTAAISVTDFSFMVPNALAYQVVGGWTGSITRYWVYTNSQDLANSFDVPAATSQWVENDVSIVAVYPDYSQWIWQDTEELPYYGIPLPLDGMTVIEWDGDTTGRAVVEGVMYKVSNVTDIDLNGCSAYYKASDGSVYGGSLIWQEAQTGLNVGVYGGDTPMCAVINSVDGLEDGLYFSSFSEGEYTTIFAYPASGGGEPTYDRTAFLRGMAMGLTGKGNPTSDMAVSGSGGGASGNYLYNGVELPALPEYDKAKYPYAAIEYINDQGLSGAYLYCTNIPLYYDPTHINSDTAKYHFGDKLASYSQWGFISNEETLSAFAAMMGVSADTLLAMGYGVGFWFHMYDANELGNLGDSNVIWSSYDIVAFVDNTVYLAASTPVPAGGTTTMDASTKGYKVGAALRRKRVLPDFN